MPRVKRTTRVPELSDFLPGAWRGSEGRFRIGKTRAGVWWLVSPDGQPVFLRAVAGVNRHGRAGPPPERPGPYALTVRKLFGAPSQTFGSGWARSAATRLHTWGVDTVGPWAEAELGKHGFHFTALADFIRAAVPTLHGPGLRLPDVFDSRWPEAAHAQAAAVCSPWADTDALIGWFTDDGLGWGAESPDGLSAFQLCLGSEPSFAAYHAAWEFALAAHGGSLDATFRDWGLERAQRERLRQFTRAELPVPGPAFAEDSASFAAELARRYFTITGAALRAADPGRLSLGCRFASTPPSAVRAAAAAGGSDALSWRLRPDTSFARQSAAHDDGPAWITGGGLGHADFHRLPLRSGTGPTRLERLLRANREGLIAACRSPRTIGIEWAHWADAADETPPFGAGLVHADDHEAHEHTEMLAHVHRRAAALHAGG